MIKKKKEKKKFSKKKEKIKNENRKFFDVNIIVLTILLNFLANMNIYETKQNEIDDENHFDVIIVMNIVERMLLQRMFHISNLDER